MDRHAHEVEKLHGELPPLVAVCASDAARASALRSGLALPELLAAHARCNGLRVAAARVDPPSGAPQGLAVRDPRVRFRALESLVAWDERAVGGPFCAAGLMC
jgi:hypothetical protein